MIAASVYFIVFGIVFGVIDAIWLKSSKSLYEKSLGHFMRDKPNFVAALLFYVIYVLGVTVFAFVPYMNGGSIVEITMTAGFLAFLCYSTYDLTNLATIKGWPIKIVIIDIVWGTLATSFAAFITMCILGIFIGLF